MHGSHGRWRIAVLVVLLVVVAAYGWFSGALRPFDPGEAEWIGTFQNSSDSSSGPMAATLVERAEGEWFATFTGKIGANHWSYDIEMMGRFDGEGTVLHGTRDLEDGSGLYRVDARIEGDRFVGGYISQEGPAGAFELERVPLERRRSTLGRRVAS